MNQVEHSTKMSTSSTDSINKNAGQSLRALLMMKRKISYWRAPGSRKSSSVDNPRIKSIIRKENTFQLDPVEDERFNVGAVKAEAEAAFHLFLGSMQKYDSNKCSQVSRYIAEDIKGRVKKLKFKRHKIVTHVVIGESSEDCSIKVASRCVWDAERDTVVSVTFEKGAIYAVATIFGIYYD